jgi:hypothetical protein
LQIPDPVPGIWVPGLDKFGSGIWNKHPGSATFIYSNYLFQAIAHRPATDHLFTSSEQQRREDVITKEVNISGRDNVKGRDRKGNGTVTCQKSEM